MTKSRNTGQLGVMNKERAAKTAAKRLGITPEEYQAHRDNNERWCYLCQKWHPETEFYRDSSKREYKRACRKSWLAYYNKRYAATNPTLHYSGGRPATCTITDVLTLKEKGLTNREIAAELGCSYAAVTRVLRGEREGLASSVEQSRHEAKTRSRPSSSDQAPT